MSMPPESASLSYDGVVVHIALSSLYRALSYVCRSVSPPASKLPDSMPVSMKSLTEI